MEREKIRLRCGKDELVVLRNLSGEAEFCIDLVVGRCCQSRMVNMVTDLAFIRRVLQAILEEKTDVTCLGKEDGPVTIDLGGHTVVVGYYETVTAANLARDYPRQVQVCFHLWDTHRPQIIVMVPAPKADIAELMDAVTIESIQDLENREAEIEARQNQPRGAAVAA